MASAKYPDPTAQVAKNDAQYRASVDSLKQVNSEIEDLQKEHTTPTQAMIEAVKLTVHNDAQEARIRRKIADAQHELVEQRIVSVRDWKQRQELWDKRHREYEDKMESLSLKQGQIISNVQRDESLLCDELLERSKKRRSEVIDSAYVDELESEEDSSSLYDKRVKPNDPPVPSASTCVPKTKSRGTIQSDYTPPRPRRRPKTTTYGSGGAVLRGGARGRNETAGKE